MRARLLLVFLVVAATSGACGGGDAACDPLTNSGCERSQQCEQVAGQSEPRCVLPVVLRGKVHDEGLGIAIPDVRVTAFDANGLALAPAASTTPDGAWEIRVRAARDSAEKPLPAQVRLRAAAQGYGSYPDGWRPWPALDVAASVRGTSPAKVGERWIVEGPTTDLGLIAFAGGPGIGSLCGQVPVAASQAAPLVVAEHTAGAVSGYVAADGAYLLHGLPPGAVRARAYARGTSYAETVLDLNADEHACRNLMPDGGALARVSGQVDLGGGATGTPTVILVVAATYDPVLRLGAQPPGLRAAITAAGTFSIDGVPAGSYLVVASPENDGLVQVDPPPRVDVVAGVDTALSAHIRLVGAINVLGPGASAAETVTGVPKLSWADSQLESGYKVTVVNYLGQTIFMKDEPKHSGDSPMVLMDRPTVKGMLYRFAVQALDDRGKDLSRTEEGAGIFTPAP